MSSMCCPQCGTGRWIKGDKCCVCNSTVVDLTVVAKELDLSVAKPFVKWAGGKRQLVSKILTKISSPINTYYEPFVGGGALFFALANRKLFTDAVLNDVNKELILTYSVIREPTQLSTLIELLATYPNTKEFFLEVRAKQPSKELLSDPDLYYSQEGVEIAARFIYLNKTGFNGLYRVNKSGGFNVPFGKAANPTICDALNLRAVSKVLAKERVRCVDFDLATAEAQAGDLVYFDPPYIPRTETSNFTAYTAEGFGLSEHRRLAATFSRLAREGVRVLLSNSDMPVIRELYSDFQVDTVDAKRSINSDGTKRGLVTELLVSANL